MSENIILEFIGKYFAFFALSGGIAYTLFVFFGKKFIENKFVRHLEELKNLQRTELEKLKFKLNLHINKINQIAEKEFDVLPKIWGKMSDALGAVSFFVNPLQHYPDLDKMNNDKIDEVLKDSGLSEADKNEINKSKSKTQKYIEIIFWIRLNEVKKSFNEFHNYFIYNKIFLSEELKVEFAKIDSLTHESIIKCEIGKQFEDHKIKIEAYKKMEEEVMPIKEKIEDIVKERLKKIEYILLETNINKD